MTLSVKRFPLGMLWTNAWLLCADGHCVLVDPGGDPLEVRRWLESHGLFLDGVFLTHGHADHIAGLEAIRDMATGGAAIHAEDASMLLNPEENLSASMGAPCTCRPAERILSDGDVLKDVGLTWEVIHTPGHTPGSVCFMVSSGEDRVLVSGDTLFAGSIGRTDLPGGSDRCMRMSLDRIARLEPPMRVLPGHGPETTLENERRSNPFWPGELR
ncbi:MAG: MBL fold metallo-hydrolase [Synergistota bacterium]|nr:MBL fold metallo-hydrolase [Synergistota bacterium]